MATASVSAVVPVFNGAETLERCLASLVVQGPPVREILIIDDGSTDGSRALVRRFAAEDPRVRVIGHAANQGIARTLNDGLAAVTGDAVLLIHQDCELLGPDWVARAADFLDAHPKTVAVGRPDYPLAEMNRVEVAFGLLRDTFFVSDAPTEDLGFTEFKCDLLPRDALSGLAFDERFRASGEDQVLSTRLSDAGYRLVRVRGLEYAQRFGRARTVRAQLRKEAAYGSAEGGILLRTSFRIARDSSASTTSARRLQNRFAGIMAALSLAAFLVVLVLSPDRWLAILPLLFVLPRIAWLVTRARRLRAQGPTPRGSLALALALFPLNDVLYAFAVGHGLLRYAAVRAV